MPDHVGFCHFLIILLNDLKVISIFFYSCIPIVKNMIKLSLVGDNMKNMTQGNVTKLIMAFAIPVLLGNVFQQFYTMAVSYTHLDVYKRQDPDVVAVVRHQAMPVLLANGWFTLTVGRASASHKAPVI